MQGGRRQCAGASQTAVMEELSGSVTNAADYSKVASIAQRPCRNVTVTCEVQRQARRPQTGMGRIYARILHVHV